MKAKFLLSVVAVVSLCSSTARAQMGFGKPKDIAIIKSQPLVVILKDEDPKELKKLAKSPRSWPNTRPLLPPTTSSCRS